MQIYSPKKGLYMHILFVYPNIMKQENISMGIAHLSSYLKSKGHTTSLFDGTFSRGNKGCFKLIGDNNPDIIAFSVLSGELSFCKNLAKEIKERFNIPIIFGGVHPTVEPEETVRINDIDMICIGEGELAFKEFLDLYKKYLDSGGRDKRYLKTKNFWFKDIDNKRNEVIIRNPVRKLIKKLDLLPFPDRELFDTKSYIKATGKLDILASRGCPFDCTYCINHIHHKMHRSSKLMLRYRSCDSVLKEIRQCIDKYGEHGIKQIVFYDDDFAADENWVKEFCEKYSKEFDIEFCCNSRAEHITDELCSMLKKANCSSIHIGIESGSEKIRKTTLNRNITNKQIKNVFNCAKKAGLKTHSFNMIGLPYETPKDIWETINLNKAVKPDSLQTSIFQPFPGTKIRELCIKNNWLTDEEIPFGSKFRSILNYPNITSKRIMRYKHKFRYLVLREYKPAIALLCLVLDTYYELLTSIRNIMPKFVKKIVHRLV